jgi:hypothetical protein
MTPDTQKLPYFFSQYFHVIVCLFTFSELNSSTIEQILKCVSTFSIAEDNNVVVRFEPPSLDGIFHLGI